MSGQLELIKGPIPSDIENAGALDNLLLNWGRVTTNWAV